MTRDSFERKRNKRAFKVWQSMSVVPQGVFAARKIRQNERILKNYNHDSCLTPTKYSSKYMNSVWGMYNRYSVHNLKKNMDFFACGGQKEQSVEKNSTDLKTFLAKHDLM
ncbi:uncharacterized protein LOC123004241 [Tribolium madens]|uniref:uncharacterized protein LOC123004241 n=1 Tax=Tribolium madens TaxID=41895 RepID=UPI001CF743BA|nr:uncharacterized protein LOC123004241 [Tribolium madens]